MATGTSIFLIALGAILAFAVDVSVAGLDIAAVGVILMIVGAVGLVFSMLYLDRMTGPARSRTTVERPVTERRVVDEPDHVVEERRGTTRRP